MFTFMFFPQGYEVESYFPMHRGCSVRLYQVIWNTFVLCCVVILRVPILRLWLQKAQNIVLKYMHNQDTAVPNDLPWLNMVQGPNGIAPTYHSCWRDLYYDLEAAQHIITITGWSVWTELR